MYFDLNGYETQVSAGYDLFWQSLSNDPEVATHSFLKYKTEWSRQLGFTKGKSAEQHAMSWMQEWFSKRGYKSDYLNKALFLTVEDENGSEKLQEVVLKYLGEGFRKYVNSDENFKIRFRDRFRDIQQGGLVDITDFMLIGQALTAMRTEKALAPADAAMDRSMQDAMQGSGYEGSDSAGKTFYGLYHLFHGMIEKGVVAADKDASSIERIEAGVGLGTDVALTFGPFIAKFGEPGIQALRGSVTKAGFKYEASGAINLGKSALSNDIRALAEAHITDNGITVLGRWNPPPGYMKYTDKAIERGASYFDIGDAWNPLTPATREAANFHFLDVIANKGDKVLLSVPKSEIIPGSSLFKEIEYLKKAHGYRWTNQWSLIKR